MTGVTMSGEFVEVEWWQKGTSDPEDVLDEIEGVWDRLNPPHRLALAGDAQIRAALNKLLKEAGTRTVVRPRFGGASQPTVLENAKHPLGDLAGFELSEAVVAVLTEASVAQIRTTVARLLRAAGLDQGRIGAVLRLRSKASVCRVLAGEMVAVPELPPTEWPEEDG